MNCWLVVEALRIDLKVEIWIYLCSSFVNSRLWIQILSKSSMLRYILVKFKKRGRLPNHCFVVNACTATIFLTMLLVIFVEIRFSTNVLVSSINSPHRSWYFSYSRLTVMVRLRVLDGSTILRRHVVLWILVRMGILGHDVYLLLRIEHPRMEWLGVCHHLMWLLIWIHLHRSILRQNLSWLHGFSVGDKAWRHAVLHVVLLGRSWDIAYRGGRAVLLIRCLRCSHPGYRLRGTFFNELDLERA